MKYLGFIWRVLRRLVWETAMDNTTGLAAQMAYLLLFALAPGSLFLWHLLGLFGTDPTKLHRMLLLLKSFMHPDPKECAGLRLSHPSLPRARRDFGQRRFQRYKVTRKKGRGDRPLSGL